MHLETTKSKIIYLNTKTYTHKSILEQWQMYKNVTKSHVQLYSKNPTPLKHYDALKQFSSTTKIDAKRGSI